MSFLPDFKIETYFSKWEFNVRYLLGASDAESMSLSELLAFAEPDDRTAWDELHLGYTETFGAPRLRETIASTYDDVAADEVICFAGAEEGIFSAMYALLEPDHHAIVVTPNYQSAETVPNSICETTGLPLDPTQDWELDLDRLRDTIRPETRLIYVNFPHNPTGKVIGRDTFHELIEIARRHGIYVFSDEVYRMLERDELLRLSQAADVYERGLSLNVTSKAYGLAGLRIGWIACKDKELLRRMERVKHYTTICSAGPSELLTIIALKAREPILERNRRLAEENLRLLDAFFDEHAELFDWYRPDGGCIGYPRYKGREGVKEFARGLVEEAGVMVVPSDIFHSELGPTPTDRFRIGFGRRDFAEGLAALRGFLRRDELYAQGRFANIS